MQQNASIQARHNAQGQGIQTFGSRLFRVNIKGEGETETFIILILAQNTDTRFITLPIITDHTQLFTLNKCTTRHLFTTHQTLQTTHSKKNWRWQLYGEIILFRQNTECPFSFSLILFFIKIPIHFHLPQKLKNKN